ncbi:hypothetical protein Bbelb_149670 [Branchiostoma belcheri]|nr:hypothetical protein Bbelb_149670 [Branchiostoma belcheri]
MDPRRPPAYGPSVGFPSIPSWNLQYPSRPVGVRDPSNLTYATEGLPPPVVIDSQYYWPPPFCYGVQPPDVYRFNHSERSPFSPIQQTADNITTTARPSTSKEASAHHDIATRRLNNAIIRDIVARKNLTDMTFETVDAIEEFMRGIKREDRMRVYQDFVRCIKARRENNRKRQKNLTSDQAVGATDPAEQTNTPAETSQELPGAAEATPKLSGGTEPPASHEMPGVTEPTPEVSGGTEPPAGHEMPGAAGPTHDLPGGAEPSYGPQYQPPSFCYGVQPPEVYRFDHSERSPFSPIQETANNITTTARPPTIKAASADQDTSARIIYNALLRNIVREKDLTSMKSAETKLAIEEVVFVPTVTTRRTCFCVLSTCKNVGKRRAPVRGEYRLRKESYGFGSTQTRRRTLSACKTFSTCGLRIHHPCVRVQATCVPRTCRAEEARVSTASLRRHKKLSSNQAACAVEPTLDLPGVAESTHEMPRTAEPTHELPRAAEPTHERLGAAEPTHELPRAAETTHKLPRAAEPTHELPRAAEPTPKLPSKSRRNSPRAAAESRRTSSRVAESRRTSSRVAESHRTNSRAAKSRRTNSRAAESRRTNPRAAERRRTNPRTAESRRSSLRIADSRRTSSRAAESRRTSSRAAESRRTSSRVAESRRTSL